MATAFLKHQRIGAISPAPNTDEPAQEFFTNMPLLKLRSRGRAVRALQKVLLNDGNILIVDGKFGRHTRASVEVFQSKNGLLVDGIVGKKTWQKPSRQNSDIQSHDGFRSSIQAAVKNFAGFIRKFFKL